MILFSITFFVFSKFIQISFSTKWLIDSPDFENPNNWFSNSLPCAQEEVVFPEEYNGMLPLPYDVAIKGFIFPRSGALIFYQDTSIILNGNSNKNPCKGTKALIRPPKAREWFNSNSWRNVEKKLKNKAVPFLEQVPCNNESVIIQSKGSIALDLGHASFLRMGQLSFQGSLISKDYLRHLLHTDLGEIIFRNQDEIIVEYYNSDTCGCHKNSNDILNVICQSVVKSCDIPHCYDSITPLGNCCPVCGASMRFSMNSCNNDNLHKMQTIVEMNIKKLNLQNDLDYHVHYINTENGEFFLQVVAVDREDYSEKSVNFIKYLNNSINWSRVLKLQSYIAYKIQYSGKFHNPNSSLMSFIFVITLCIIFCLLIGLTLFAYLEPNHRYLSYIPQWLHNPRSWLRFSWRGILPSSSLMFARFENTRFSTRTINDALENNDHKNEPNIVIYNTTSERKSWDNDDPHSLSVTTNKGDNNIRMENVVLVNHETDDSSEDQDPTAFNMNIL